MDERLEPPAAGTSAAVAALLQRHEIGESRRQIATLEAVLEMTPQVARRRMAGTSPWTIEELEKLALHFNEPMFELVANMLATVGPSRRATLLVGGSQVHCSIWLGRPLAPHERSEPLVAISEDQKWMVVPVGEAAGQTAHEIARLVYETELQTRVAVLDDDLDVAEPIAQFLRAKGLAAWTYGSTEQVRAALKEKTFAGFVLDWYLKEGNVLALLAEIRATEPAAPIVILTGRILDGTVSEDEVAQAAAKYRTLVIEKPVRPLVLYNALLLHMRGLTTGNTQPPPNSRNF